jgi:FkbM family methyltransferase
MSATSQQARREGKGAVKRGGLVWQIRSVCDLWEENSLKTIANFLLHHLRESPLPVKVRFQGIPLELRGASPDLDVAKSCLFQGEFGSIRKGIPRLKSRFIVDAGGYIGTAALALAQEFPEATIVTLEPSEPNFRVLKANVDGFKNIIPLNNALVASERRVAVRDVGQLQWGHSILSSGGCILNEAHGTTIDALLKDFGKPGIDVLKLDIEGSEKELFDCSPDWLRNVGVLVIELHDKFLAGCSRSFYRATESFRDVAKTRDKIVCINDAYFA